MQIENKDFNMLTSFSLVEKDATVVGDESTIVIAGYCNYSGPDANGKTYVDLSGDVIASQGIDVSVWASNPVILLNHQRDQVIGKGTRVEKRDDGLYMECELHRDAMSEKDWYRIKSGLTCHFSVGFRTLDATYKEIDGREVYFITKCLLLENSVVNIPANSMSKFNRIKSLEDGTFTSEVDTDNKNIGVTSETDKETTMTNIKVKRADLLSPSELEQFKSLGGNEAEEVEVSLASYIKGLVAAALAEAKAAEEAQAKEAQELAEKEAAELAQKEAEEAAKVEAEAKAAEEAAKLEEETKAAQEIAELKEIIQTIKSAIAEQK